MRGTEREVCSDMREESFWNTVPIFLKPDALVGTCTTVPGGLAADYAMYLSAALAHLDEPKNYHPFFDASPQGARNAREHVLKEMRELPWYTLSLKSVRSCQERLHGLHSSWSKSPEVEVSTIVSESCSALGFEIALVVDRILNADDYWSFYKDSDEPHMHPLMERYLVGNPVRLILLCGRQENSALQVMKTYLRRVMRYPTEAPKIQNWLHVTDPDASNFPDVLRRLGPAHIEVGINSRVQE